MKSSFCLGLGLVSALSLGGCIAGDDADSKEPVAEATELLCGVSGTLIDRSLAVTDPTILAKFSFKRTMDQIRTTANVTTTETSQTIYKRWMRTFGATTSSGDCDDASIDPNHYGLKCPRTPELKLSRVNPFSDTSPLRFNPVGLFNRFDLAPSSGAHCGEYRIVYAMSSADTTVGGRGFIIFEGVLPNPDPASGVTACLPVAQFWQSLTDDADVASRAAKLEKFYYTGGAVAGFSPVVQAADYGLSTSSSSHPAGQVRTDFFIDSIEWNLREFKLGRSCTDAADPATCALDFNHVTVKVNPAEELFAGTNANSNAFQAAFLAQVSTLSASNVNKIKMNVNDSFNEFESVSQALNVNYATNTEADFRAQITSQLATNGSALTATNILDRATTQTCAGCHHVSNIKVLGGGLTWPTSLSFTHVDEGRNLSPALTSVFLPNRKTVLEKFINNRCAGLLVAQDGLTVGGAPEGAPN